jgi:hypothetical protein
MILFRDAVAMVDQSPALAQRINKSGGAGKVEPCVSSDRLIFPAYQFG